MARDLIEPALAGQRLQMGYDEWLAWSDQEFKSEWVDGKVFIYVSSSRRHGHLVWFLAVLLGHFVQFRRLGEVQTESMAMRLERSGRVPDIFFVAADHLHRLTATQVRGPADLVVEVVSEDSPVRDRSEKFAEYAAAGIPEYWIVDSRPAAAGPAFFFLDGDTYRPIPLDAEGRVHSLVVPGFWLRPAWLEQDPLPDALLCLDEIAPEALDMPRRRGRA